MVLLYLFLFSAFRTLRADLRAPLAAHEGTVAERALEDRRRAYQPAVAGNPYVEYDDFEEAPVDEPAFTDSGFDDDAFDEDEFEEEPWEPVPTPAPTSFLRRLPLNIAIPSGAAVALVILGGVALFAGEDPPAENVTTPPAPTTEAFAPPAVPPAPGRVTVGLAATTDALVRVTVDGVVQFDGTLRAGQTQAWEAGDRIQVWTDSGKTLLLAVNGENLGPYSPAMMRPDWNRIDYGFWPGWAQ